MVLYPECQAKAQEELDTILGPGRLPEFSDRDSLPYLERLLHETLRWNHPIPTDKLLPQADAVSYDIYDGLFIRKGSLVIPNIRGMTWDESLYADPFSFDPTQFSSDGRNKPLPSATWGFGRRICPGRYLADSSLWIAMATILLTLEISKEIDEDGKEITPEVKFVTSVARQARSMHVPWIFSFILTLKLSVT
ncbi:cytochrome P450 [Lyophyllum atratum]|nr:cytochrome P450 [Lyophyllum atratum]